MNRISAILVLAFSQGSLGTALSEDSATDVYFTDEIPLVLSATRLAQPQTEAPATITLIDRNMIKASGAQEVAELFRLVPGMQVTHILGNRPMVSYHGITDENPQGVQVIIDGRSVYAPLFGGVDWANLPLMIEDIERIEVIRGPNSTSFGSNSFQSVVHITTIHGSQNQGGTIQATFGERDFSRTFFRYGNHVGNLDYRVSVSHLDDGGYASLNDDKRQNILSTRFDYQLSPFDNVQLNLGLSDTLREISGEPLSPDPVFPNRNVDESNQYIHGRWERNSNERGTLITQLSYSVFNRKDKIYSVFDDPFWGMGAIFSADNSAFTDRWDFEIEHQLNLTESVRWVWGLGYRQDRVELPMWLGTDDTFHNRTRRLFGNLEWRLTPKLILNLGSLWEDTEVSGSDIAPKLAVNFLPNRHHSFRLIASRSMRTPVVAEENFNRSLVYQAGAGFPLGPGTAVVPGLTSYLPGYSVDSDLDNETVDLLELGYHGLFVQNRLDFDFKLFHVTYKDIIDYFDFDDVPNQNTFNGMPVPGFPIDIDSIDNLYDASMTGFEIEINYRPNLHNLIHVGYSSIQLDSVNYIGGPLTNGNPGLREREFPQTVPENTFNLLAMHTFDNQWWTSLGYYYTSGMEFLGGGNPQGPFKKMDLNVGKSFNRNERETVELMLRLELALDRNRDFTRGVNHENRAFVSLRYAFE